MTYFLLKFRSSVLDGTLEPETMAGQPLCMAQYRRMFSVIREPGEHEDELVEWDPHAYKHVVVLVNNRFFAFDVLDSSDAIMGLDDLTTYVATPHPGWHALTHFARAVKSSVSSRTLRASSSKTAQHRCRN